MRPSVWTSAVSEPSKKGTSFDLVEKSGDWYSFKGERMGQGRENVKKFLVENADIRNQIVDLIKEKSGLRKVKQEANSK
jgi:recombination protein RecA